LIEPCFSRIIPYVPLEFPSYTTHLLRKSSENFHGKPFPSYPIISGGGRGKEIPVLTKKQRAFFWGT